MRHLTLEKRFPPSEPCSCDICQGYCQRPGWWSVEQAEKVIAAGYADRMMLEVSPEFTFGVLAPAFKGNEANIAIQTFARHGCTFLEDHLCTLFGTGLQPLECRVCHHSRHGLGPKCHAALEADWHSKAGQKLVIRWSNMTHIFERYGVIIVESDRKTSK